MFKSIDTSVLDDSTGLKLLNYLARNEDNANGRRGPRSRKELFRLKSSEGIAADDFSIRQLKEKENRVSDKASSSRRTLAQDRSSLFVSCACFCSHVYILNDANLPLPETELYEHTTCTDHCSHPVPPVEKVHWRAKVPAPAADSNVAGA